MQFQDESKLFQYQSVTGWESAKKKLMSQSGLLFRPYYTDQAQRQALVYPFAHAAQCVANVVSIMYGAYLIAKSIFFAGPADTLTMTTATLIQCLNLLLNLCNVFVSLFSLGSRALTTIVNRKYVFEPKYLAAGTTSRPISQNINQFQMANELAQRTEEQVAAGEQEERNRSLSLSFV